MARRGGAQARHGWGNNSAVEFGTTTGGQLSPRRSSPFYPTDKRRPHANVLLAPHNIMHLPFLSLSLFSAVV